MHYQGNALQLRLSLECSSLLLRLWVIRH